MKKITVGLLSFILAAILLLGVFSSCTTPGTQDSEIPSQSESETDSSETEESRDDENPEMPQLSGEHADLIANADVLKNNVTAYYTDGERNHVVFENMEMKLDYAISGDENQQVASLTTKNGNPYVSDTMDVFIRMDGGDTYYAKRSYSSPAFNICRLGYYFYEMKVEGQSFAGDVSFDNAVNVDIKKPEFTNELDYAKFKGEYLMARNSNGAKDPHIVFSTSLSVPAEQHGMLEITIRADEKTSNSVDVFYMTEGQKDFSSSQRVNFTLVDDGKYRTYLIPLSSGSDYSQNPDRLGEKPLMNALFYKSLLCMSELAEVVGDSRAEEWRLLAEKVKKAINDRLWSEDKKAYIDTFNDSHIPQDGNALCLFFGIAEGDRAATVMKTLEEKLWTPYGATMSSEPDSYQYGGDDVISPLMNTYEAAARFTLGDSEGALELMRRCWGSMIRRGATSFWEYTDTSEGNKPKHFSGCHAWSAGCSYLLGAYVLGISPLSPGYERLLFHPCENFESFEGVVPTPKGLVAVSCKSENGNKKYTLALPKDLAITVELPENAVLETLEY